MVFGICKPKPELAFVIFPPVGISLKEREKLSLWSLSKHRGWTCQRMSTTWHGPPLLISIFAFSPIRK
ncbi:MAG TPA: hypothetical protein VFB48_01545 [Nitrososphaeraceae archaeon]|nr:hypothetical protein [Nitrososphaeraceae archaeon]